MGMGIKGMIVIILVVLCGMYRLISGGQQRAYDEQHSFVYATIQALLHSNHVQYFFKNQECAHEQSVLVRRMQELVEHKTVTASSVSMICNEQTGLARFYDMSDDNVAPRDFLESLLKQLGRSLRQSVLKKDFEHLYSTQVEQKISTNPHHIVERQVLSLASIPLFLGSRKNLYDGLRSFCTKRQVSFTGGASRYYQQRSIMRLPHLLVIASDAANGMAGITLPDQLDSLRWGNVSEQELGVASLAFPSNIRHELIALVIRKQQIQKNYKKSHYVAYTFDKRKRMWLIHDSGTTEAISQEEMIRRQGGLGFEPVLVFYDRIDKATPSQGFNSCLMTELIDVVKIALHRLKSSLRACHDQLRATI